MSHEISLKQPTMSHEFSLVHLISPEHEQANSRSIRASIDFDEELDSTLKEMHFQQGMEEKAVYRKVPNREFIIVAVYVDELTYYLGIEVSRKKYFVKIKQERYATKILKEAGMEDCIATLRPMNRDSSYLTYSVGVVSRYMQSLRESHARAIKQILHYLKGAILFGIEYKQGNHMKLVGFWDSSHNVDIDDGHSTTSCVSSNLAKGVIGQRDGDGKTKGANTSTFDITSFMNVWKMSRLKDMISLIGVQELPSSTPKFRDDCWRINMSLDYG
ncbi:hypothetical protein Tco_1324460 [Tanacetum coccineum]